jgi:hypothetical protein
MFNRISHLNGWVLVFVLEILPTVLPKGSPCGSYSLLSGRRFVRLLYWTTWYWTITDAVIGKCHSSSTLTTSFADFPKWEGILQSVRKVNYCHPYTTLKTFPVTVQITGLVVSFKYILMYYWTSSRPENLRHICCRTLSHQQSCIC